MTAVTPLVDVPAVGRCDNRERPHTLRAGTTYDVGVLGKLGVIELGPMTDVLVDLQALADASGLSFEVTCGTCGGRGTTGQPRNSNVRPCRPCRGVGSTTVAASVTA